MFQSVNIPLGFESNVREYMGREDNCSHILKYILHEAPAPFIADNAVSFTVNKFRRSILILDKILFSWWNSGKP